MEANKMFIYCTTKQTEKKIYKIKKQIRKENNDINFGV
jgi:hypothetical protein